MSPPCLPIPPPGRVCHSHKRVTLCGRQRTLPGVSCCIRSRLITLLALAVAVLVWREASIRRHEADLDATLDEEAHEVGALDGVDEASAAKVVRLLHVGAGAHEAPERSESLK